MRLQANLFRLSRGWTLAELLIAVAIVALVTLAVLIGFRTQIARGYDAKRKTDLDSIHKAFEEYYNDHGCYPLPGILDNCGSDALTPYLVKIPCDPVTKQPYKYVPEGNPCLGFRACVALQDKGDPAIASLGCDPVEGCGWGAGYNYCISSGVTVVAPDFVPGGGTPTPTPGGGGTPTPTPAGATPTPTPTPGGGATPTPAGATPTPTPTPGGPGYACTPSGDCNFYADPVGSGCPRTYSDLSCGGECTNPANRCKF